VFLACQDTRFILCVFTFLRVKPGWGVDLSPLGVGCALDYLEGWGDFKENDKHAFWGQYFKNQFMQRWITNKKFISCSELIVGDCILPQRLHVYQDSSGGLISV